MTYACIAAAAAAAGTAVQQSLCGGMLAALDSRAVQLRIEERERRINDWR